MYDISEMEQLPSGEVEMGARLKALGWERTERFHNRTAYYNRQRKLIGVTLWSGPLTHKHYALRIAQ